MIPMGASSKAQVMPGVMCKKGKSGCIKINKSDSTYRLAV